MEKLFLIFFLMVNTNFMHAQKSTDTVKKEIASSPDDPSQFLTRVEIFNEFQHHDNPEYNINQTVLRTILKVGKRFTTRIDLPYMYNSVNTSTKQSQSGIGDISFRLLGFKFMETPKSAFTASMEVSLNTAQSPALGTGKTLLIPVLSYSRFIPSRKMIVAVVLQQTNSISGDKQRKDISFSKIQLIAIQYFTKRTWLVLAPEWFLDYVNGGLSMNLRTRLTHALTPRVNLWATPSAGIFGDFAGRYQWSADIGARYFLFKEMNSKKK
jgi:hypothetical protein